MTYIASLLTDEQLMAYVLNMRDIIHKTRSLSRDLKYIPEAAVAPQTTADTPEEDEKPGHEDPHDQHHDNSLITVHIDATVVSSEEEDAISINSEELNEFYNNLNKDTDTYGLRVVCQHAGPPNTNSKQTIFKIFR
ncbi:unnamed protein product [Schistosoma turkestanicum]|nr:unnamed protein product [Schistosoma turkestanicum]